jgi:hypothetical protein
MWTRVQVQSSVMRLQLLRFIIRCCGRRARDEVGGRRCDRRMEDLMRLGIAAVFFGPIQVMTWTGQNIFSEYRKEFEEFLNGFRVKSAPSARELF